jgi:hypothetical protein
MKRHENTDYIIDLRAHVLPLMAGAHGRDDAADIMAVFRAMGIVAAVATADVCLDKTPPRAYVEMEKRARENLLGVRMKRAPAIFSCAELDLTDNMATTPELSSLAVGKSRLLLVKLPRAKWDADLLDTLAALRFADYQPLLANVGAYRPEAIEELFSLGYKGQLDLSSIATLDLRRRRRYLRWIDAGNVIAIGSGMTADDLDNIDAFLRRLRRAKKILRHDRLKILAEHAELLLGTVESIN